MIILRELLQVTSTKTIVKLLDNDNIIYKGYPQNCPEAILNSQVYKIKPELANLICVWLD